MRSTVSGARNSVRNDVVVLTLNTRQRSPHLVNRGQFLRSERNLEGYPIGTRRLDEVMADREACEVVPCSPTQIHSLAKRLLMSGHTVVADAHEIGEGRLRALAEDRSLAKDLDRLHLVHTRVTNHVWDVLRTMRGQREIEIVN